MGWFSSLKAKAPWYAAGLAFECTQCGRCCAGPNEGYVWVTEEEIAAIAARLGVSPDEFRRQYARLDGGRWTLIERADNHDCIFLTQPGDEAQQPADKAPAGESPTPACEPPRACADVPARGCRIYTVRPQQCRNWPFWPGNLGSPDDWSRAAGRCPGVNRGQEFTVEAIHERMQPPNTGKR